MIGGLLTRSVDQRLTSAGPPLPPAAPPPQPPPQPRPARSTTTQWLLAGAVTAAGAVALVFLAISQGKDGANGPEGAAEQLLEASKNQDLSAAQAILCQEDLSSGFLTDELPTLDMPSGSVG